MQNCEIACVASLYALVPRASDTDLFGFAWSRGAMHRYVLLNPYNRSVIDVRVCGVLFMLQQYVLLVGENTK